MADQEKCSRSVYDHTGFHSYPCRRLAVEKFEGKWLCKMHLNGARRRIAAREKVQRELRESGIRQARVDHLVSRLVHVMKWSESDPTQADGCVHLDPDFVEAILSKLEEER